MKPGEVSLAHNGVLFLDELPEFSSQALDSLRQPLETGEVVVARANAHVRYPARFQLIAAQNPCKCGMGGAGRGACGRAPRCQTDYQMKVSGPFMDRIDLQIDVPPVTAADLALPAPAEGTVEAAARVAVARQLQADRAADTANGDGAPLNAQAQGDFLEKIADLDPAARALGQGGRGRRPDRPRVDPHPAAGPDHRRPGGARPRAPHPCGRGADLSSHGPGVPGPRLTERRSALRKLRRSTALDFGSPSRNHPQASRVI